MKKRSLTIKKRIKQCLMFFVVLTICTGIPQVALAQWGGYGGGGYYSDYEEYYYSESGDCACGDSGWLSYIPYVGGCNNKIEVDDKPKF